MAWGQRASIKMLKVTMHCNGRLECGNVKSNYRSKYFRLTVNFQTAISWAEKKNKDSAQVLHQIYFGRSLSLRHAEPDTFFLN